MVILPLNYMFWRSVAEAILIDRHMLFYGKLLVFMQKVALNLNLNSLLVKRQIDNPSPGAVTGGN